MKKELSLHGTKTPVRDMVDHYFEKGSYWDEATEKISVAEIKKIFDRHFKVPTGPITKAMVKMGFEKTERKSGVHFLVIRKAHA